MFRTDYLIQVAETFVENLFMRITVSKVHSFPFGGGLTLRMSNFPD
jgi:hypothetical protein